MSNYPLTYAELKAINQGLVTARREELHRIKKLEAENLDLLRDLSISIEHNEQLQVDNERLTFLCRKLADKPPLTPPEDKS